MPTQDDAASRKSESGKRQADKMRETHGPDYYRTLGGLGGNATRDAHDPDYYKRLGALGGPSGGAKTRDVHGGEFYAAIGRKGQARMRTIIAAGKAALGIESKKPD